MRASSPQPKIGRRRGRSHRLSRVLFATTFWILAAGCAAGPTLVDLDPTGDFAIFRFGRLSRGELAEICDLGVEELVIMDGSGESFECRMRDEICPGIRVRYDWAQDPREPVSETFLSAFDRWVVESQGSGRKIAFRCRHGWHRTGRLAAYYRMRYQGWTRDEAIAEMLNRGRWMVWYPELAPQVEALAEMLETGSCTSEPARCPRPTEAAAEGLEGVAAESFFADDVCAPGVIAEGAR